MSSILLHQPFKHCSSTPHRMCTKVCVLFIPHVGCLQLCSQPLTITCLTSSVIFPTFLHVTDAAILTFQGLFGAENQIYDRANAANLFASSSVPAGNANLISTVSEVEFTPNLWLDFPGFYRSLHANFWCLGYFCWPLLTVDCNCVSVTEHCLPTTITASLDWSTIDS